MLIDLTLSLAADNPVFGKAPTDRAAALMAAGHIGTHLDTLLHRPIPLDWMDRDAVLVDATKAGTDIGSDVLAGVAIQPGDVVLVHTGHIRRHAYGDAAYFRDHPQLDWDLVEALMDRKVSFIGIDAAGLRRGHDEHAKVDRYCEENGSFVIENLINLDHLQAAAARRFPLRVAWISHAGRTGIPVKVVATLPDAWSAPV
jgi:kynurenine formamidase